MPPTSKPAMAGLRLSIMMFLQFFVWGAWYVTVGNYMGAHGLTDVIFWAYTVGPIAAIISPFFLGMIADRFFASERVLAVLHILGGIALMLTPRMANYQWSWAPETGAFAFLREGPFIGMLMLHMLCYMPTLGLTNTVAFNAMTNPEKQFPMIRVFGTIGWIAAGFCVSGFAVDSTDRVFNSLGDTPLGQFHLAGAAAIMLGMYSFTLPHTPPPAKGKRFSIRDALGLDALLLMRKPSFAIFVLCSMLVCIPLAAYYSYTGTFVEKGLGAERVASVILRGQLSEIFFMLIMPLCFVRLGVKWMLAVGMLAWVARYALFSWAAGMPQADHGPVLGFLAGDPHISMPVFIGIILHGICYDFFFVAGSIHTEREAPKEIRASAQGFLVLVTQGVGMLIGAQVAGWRFEATGKGEDWRTFWLFPCLFAFGVLVVFVLTFRHRNAPSASTR